MHFSTTRFRWEIPWKLIQFHFILFQIIFFHSKSIIQKIIPLLRHLVVDLKLTMRVVHVHVHVCVCVYWVWNSQTTQKTTAFQQTPCDKIMCTEFHQNASISVHIAGLLFGHSAIQLCAICIVCCFFFCTNFKRTKDEINIKLVSSACKKWL